MTYSWKARVYNYTCLTDGNYTSRYIRNRMTQVTVTSAGRSVLQLATNTYDNYSTVCGGAAGMVLRNGAGQHDDTNYGTGFVYRGNVTSRSALGGSASMRYESTAVVMCGMDGAGYTTTTAPASSSNYSLPGVLTPGENANLATSITYANSCEFDTLIWLTLIF